jgi:hypothetical protein
MPQPLYPTGKNSQQLKNMRPHETHSQSGCCAIQVISCPCQESHHFPITQLITLSLFKYKMKFLPRKRMLLIPNEVGNNENNPFINGNGNFNADTNSLCYRIV